MMAMISEMEFMQGEIQSHSVDVLDSSLALIRSAMSVKDIDFFSNKIEFIVNDQEQYDNLNTIIDCAMTTFTNYYYVASENYVEHPYYGVTLRKGEPLADYHKHYYDNNPLFNIEYKKLSDLSTQISFSIKNKDKCRQALEEYCFSYGCDCVFNEECNTLTCEAQNEALYSLLTANAYNLSNFIVNDIKYMKAICYNESLNKLSVVSIDINLSKDNKLIFKGVISANEFVEEYNANYTKEDTKKEHKTQKNKSKKVRKHFSPTVQELYNFIKMYAKARDYMIYPSELIGEKPTKLYDKMGTLTTMVNRLNEQYREMILDESVTLMRYDKTLECYMIKDIWNN